MSSMSIKETARRLNVSEGTVRRMVREEILPSFRVGHQIRIPEEQLNKWIGNGGARRSTAKLTRIN